MNTTGLDTMMLLRMVLGGGRKAVTASVLVGFGLKVAFDSGARG